MKRLFTTVLVLFSLSLLVASEYGGSLLGPDVAEFNGKKLQWEAGSYDYFVMFKSLLANNDPFNDSGGDNPSADACLDSSTYVLDVSRVPLDAYIESAYIVWNSAIGENLTTQPADNSVHLKFEHQDSAFDPLEVDVATSIAKVASDKNQDFEFEAVDTTPAGATSGTAWVTYRAEITDFFNQIHTKGREAEVDGDGVSLFGSYTVSGLTCTDDDFYRTNGGSNNNSVMVSNWSIILIYRSEEISAKNIYMYRGFDIYSMQEVDISVRGFEFPADPIVKLTMIVSEGDPSLAIASDLMGCGGACPPEGLMISGQTQTEYAPLFNDCNPPRDVDSNGTPYMYTEMYNSISSVYGWADKTPVCSGAYGDLSSFEYAMDVDTLRLDGSEWPFNEQLKEDDTEFKLKVGANGDMIFTNMLIVSVDTRAPKFDIPVNDNTASGREKNFCSCAEEADKICTDFPFYFSIKIQNWGDDTSENVTLKDSLTNLVSYVPGTTEICRETDDGDMCTKWEKFDDVGGGFPFVEATKIADSMAPCDRATFACTDTIWVRFQVSPSSDLPKHAVIENTALIADATGAIYKSNTSVPLRLKIGTCGTNDECLNPDMTLCGGNVEDKCTGDDDCGTGMECDKDSGVCVLDESKVVSGANVTVFRSPRAFSVDETTIVPSPVKGVTLAQFGMREIVGKQDKIYFLKQLSAKVARTDRDINLTNIKLYLDNDGNGLVGADDVELAVISELKNDYLTFDVMQEKGGITAGVSSYFIIVADANYLKDSIPSKNSFNISIEKSGDVVLMDAGTPTVILDETPLEFSEYRLEPDGNYVIVSKAVQQPSVPTPNEVNGNQLMMNIMIKATEEDNTLTALSVSVPMSSVAFAHGISQVSIYHDANSNYINDGDPQIGSIVPTTPRKVKITFATPLALKAGEIVNIMIYGDLDLDSPENAQISIVQSTDVLVSNRAATVIGPPFTSAIFSTECQENDPACSGATTVNDGGCSLIIIE